MQTGYPLNLLLDDRLCLVLGGGDEAALRVRNLLEAGARVVVVGEHPTPALAALAESAQVQLRLREFVEADLEGAWLVVQADQNAALASRVAELCQARRLFFCAVDQPAYSSYSHVALARAGALTLAISTEGRVPALGRRLREELSRLLEAANAAEQVERLARLRDATPAANRREVLSQAVQGVHFTGALRFDQD